MLKFLTTLPLWETRHDEAAHVSRQHIDSYERGKFRCAIGNGASGDPDTFDEFFFGRAKEVYPQFDFARMSDDEYGATLALN